MHKYRIMTFDGGGIKGVLTATLLKRLHQEIPEFINMTQLFTGTSTGSFIALGLAYGLSPQELVELYTRNAKYIFTPNYLELHRPKYDNEHLKKVLSSIFPKDLRLSDLSYKVLVPSFQVTGYSPEFNWKPVFYSNLPDSNNKNERVIDVAMASSAAPIFFPSYNHHIDGGVVANNPSTAAIAAAKGSQNNTEAIDDMYLLSFGTGKSIHNITVDTTKWGALQWAFYPDPPFPLLNILFDGAIEADVYYSFQLLKEQYYRINPEIPKEIGSVSLDAYSKIPDLIFLAKDYNLESTINWIKENWF